MGNKLESKVKKIELNTGESPQRKESIRFVCLSDTHSYERDIKEIPEGDVLIHAGDFTEIGEIESVIKLNEFLGELPHRHKVVIAGNHENLMDSKDFYRKRYFANKIHPDKYSAEYVKSVLTNCMYLEDSGCIIEGYKIYGSPYCPIYNSYWAFTLPRDSAELEAKWKVIETDVDILITHAPPYSIGDKTSNGHDGCKKLLTRVTQVQPLVHIFGHIHEGYGMYILPNIPTLFINASSTNKAYQIVNKPLVFDLPIK